MNAWKSGGIPSVRRERRTSLEIELGQVQQRVLEPPRPVLFRVDRRPGLRLQEGTDQRYGDATLKRAIERHVVYPLAICSRPSRSPRRLVALTGKGQEQLNVRREGETCVPGSPADRQSLSASAQQRAARRLTRPV